MVHELTRPNLAYSGGVHLGTNIRHAKVTRGIQKMPARTHGVPSLLPGAEVHGKQN